MRLVAIADYTCDSQIHGKWRSRAFSQSSNNAKTAQTKKRSEAIETFQSGQVPVFLISLKAGGVRLNLTAADTVIHYNPWWNPAAKLAQSIVSTDHEGNIKLSEDEWLGLFDKFLGYVLMGMIHRNRFNLTFS